MTSDSYFSQSNIPIRQILSLLYLWAADTPVRIVPHLIGLSKVSVIQWYQYFTDVCSHQLNVVKEGGFKLGGPGEIVQIDESLFNRRKYHRGRIVREQKWVFGIYDTNLKQGILQFVEDRKAVALLPIIQEYVVAGTTIWSDKWKAYTEIGNLPENYDHGIVNHRYVQLPSRSDVTTAVYSIIRVPDLFHSFIIIYIMCHSYNFVNPETGVCTNAIEAYWSRVKKIRRRKQVVPASEHLPSYLDEFMWRNFYECATPADHAISTRTLGAMGPVWILLERL